MSESTKGNITDRTLKNIVFLAILGFIMYQATEYLPLLFMDSGDKFLQISVFIKIACYSLWGIVAFWLFFVSKGAKE